MTKQLTFFIIGNNNNFLINFINECINEIKQKFNLNIDIKIINNQNYTKEDYFNCYYNNINNASYFNTFLINFSTKKEIFNVFKEFNNNYNETYINSDSYPFFLIDENIFNKKELIKDIKIINENKPIECHIQSKDILAYSNNDSLKNKIFKIYKYYTENEELLNEYDKEEKTLNLLLCGIKGVGKTFLINKLLFENRGLSKENNHTTKLNKYHHKLYPIVFYDIPGFGENEDREMTNTKSYINQFNKQYDKIKDKIHIILYLFNCDGARLLQDKEIELIENFLTYNIPIYFIGNKCNPKDEKTFKRSILFNLKKVKSKYTIEYFESHIFCLNNTNKSIYSLLAKISEDELENSKNAHINIIKEYENNNYFNDSIEKYHYNEEENDNNLYINEQNDCHQKIILNEMKNSIFFNEINYSLNRIQEKVLEITENIKNNSNTYLIPFKSLEKDFNKLANQIETEYKKLINENDLKEIEKIIEKYPEKKVNKEQIIDGFGIFGLVTPFVFLALNPLMVFFSAGGLGILIYNIFSKKIKNKIKIDDFSKKINKKFMNKVALYNNILTKINAEKFNNIIDNFKDYIKHFQIEIENDIDLIDIKSNELYHIKS